MTATASFANLVVKYGAKNFLDFEDVSLRAFLNDTNVRAGGTHYHFLDVKCCSFRMTIRSLSVFSEDSLKVLSLSESNI